MTILAVVKDVCAAVGVQVPASVFASITANRTMQEMLAVANEMAQRIAYDTRDWTLFKTVQTFTGNGTQTDFPLPANYKRMLLTANVWRSTDTQTPMVFVPDADEWIQRRMSNAGDISRGEWTMLGGNMVIWPAMDGSIPAWVGTTASGGTTAYGVGALVHDPLDWSLWTSKEAHASSGSNFAAERAANPTWWASTPHSTATFVYLDKNCVVLASGGFGDRFMADGDSFRLDERLLKLGMTYQWKAHKGSPYSEDMGTYSDAMQIALRFDNPSPILIDRLPASRWTRDAQYS